MNGERLLALYDRVADAPDAIGRLRRFVLDLAVRGRLVEQDPADEPATNLLKRIAAERARPGNLGRTRRKNAVCPQMAPPPFVLPRTWCWVSLGAVFQYDAGTKCHPKALDSSVWLLELQDIEKGTGRLLNRVRTSDRGSKSTKSRFSPGDILYGKLRPYLNKVLVADQTGYSTTEIVAIRPYLQLSSEYCALALRRPDFVDYVTRLGQGTKMPRLRTKDAVVAPFPLPPLAEQRRIVAKVDELMAVCDRLEETRTVRGDTRDRLTKASYARLSDTDTDGSTFRSHARFVVDALPALTARADQVKQLRQMILNLAVRGKLVEQDSADEPATALLSRIAEAKATLVVAGKFKTLSGDLPAGHSTFPFEIPASWTWCYLDDLAAIARGGSPRPIKAYLTSDPDGIPWIKIGDSVRGTIYISHTKQRIRREGLSKSRLVFPGDLLLSNSMSFGHPYITRIEGCIHDGWLVIRTPETLVDKLYLHTLFRSDHAKRVFSEMASGAVVKNLNADKARQLSVPLPPLAEQRRIVAKVDQLMVLCDGIEAGLAGAAGTRSRFLESLLQDTLASDENLDHREGS